MWLGFGVAVTVVWAGNCSSNSTRGPGTSIFCRCGCRKKKKISVPNLIVPRETFSSVRKEAKKEDQIQATWMPMPVTPEQPVHPGAGQMASLWSMHICCVKSEFRSSLGR